MRAERRWRAFIRVGRRQHRKALARTTALVVRIRERGVTLTAIAAKIARALRLTPTVERRRLYAARLRKRIERTPGHADLRRGTT
ncbi:hypothetical protein ACOQFB_01100 [Anaeromyxobacter sp. Red801]|uniref:hypothetical protein n=1 Tax=Anaeromyxobacter sp. Red801 TaxID=3411632 RepID=UPI003B9E769C